VKLTAKLRAAGVLDDDGEADLQREVAEEVAAAITFADRSEYPNPAEALTDVW
jgi:TPP-dependent pyruvate/acetoin dehydrogenase alpha subunit